MEALDFILCLKYPRNHTIFSEANHFFHRYKEQLTFRALQSTKTFHVHLFLRNTNFESGQTI